MRVNRRKVRKKNPVNRRRGVIRLINRNGDENILDRTRVVNHHNNIKKHQKTSKNIKKHKNTIIKCPKYYSLHCAHESVYSLFVFV